MSGVSYNGGASRCWYNWQKFIDCYTAKDTEDPRQACKIFAEDYQECLFHTKEIERAQKIAAEFERREKKGDEDLPAVKTQKHLKRSLTDLDLIK